MRAFLPKDTPIIAVSATLTPRVKEDIIGKLQLKCNYVYINTGNNRPNVAQVVRAMEHPMKSHRDLDFLIPTTINSPADIAKTFLYTDDVKEGVSITDYLNEHVPEALQTLGLVRPYNAAMSKKYRKGVMKLFRDGAIRILVCTDAAGMVSDDSIIRYILLLTVTLNILQGCNIADIDLVVQWKLPHNLSSWVQRSGRAARGSGRHGLAVMIVEKSAYEVSPIERISNTKVGPTLAPPITKVQTGRRHIRKAAHSKNGPEYGVLHGSKRGQHSGKHDIISAINEFSEVPRDAIKEGLYLYIQTTNCRRGLLATVFENVAWGEHS